jgi:hypothetical protein
LDELRVQNQEQMEKNLIAQKEEIEKLRKENDKRISEILRAQNSTGTYSYLVENYKTIRDQNCDLNLELADGKTLGVHKTILMGNLLAFHPK